MPKHVARLYRNGALRVVISASEACEVIYGKFPTLCIPRQNAPRIHVIDSSSFVHPSTTGTGTEAVRSSEALGSCSPLAATGRYLPLEYLKP